MSRGSDDANRSGANGDRFIRFRKHRALDLPNDDWTIQVRIKVINKFNSFPYPISMGAGGSYHVTPSFGGFASTTSVKMWFQDDSGNRYGDTDHINYASSPPSWITSTFMRRGANTVWFADTTKNLDTAHGLSNKITCASSGINLGVRSDLDASRYMYARFSDFAIWHRALTDDEVAALARGERATAHADRLSCFEPLNSNRQTTLVGNVPIAYGRSLQAPDPENLQPLAGIRPTWFLPLAGAAPTANRLMMFA